MTGRRDDVIISGGLKVSLGAVERLIRERLYPDAVVVAATTTDGGRCPSIVTTDLGDGEVRGDRRTTSAAPRGTTRVLHVNRLPLLPSGKPDRVA